MKAITTLAHAQSLESPVVLTNRIELDPFRSQIDQALDPWSEAVDGKVLLDSLAQVFRRFVVLPEWTPETLALWTVHTYAFQLRDVTTYIGIESPEKRCGKTTLLALLSELVNRPVVAANISPSALFRVIQETQPTLLIDEADTFLQSNEELRGILNSGYSRKTAYVVRVGWQTPYPESRAEGTTGLEAGGNGGGEGRSNGGPRLATFSCWCPKVMARIGRLPETLADRCVVIRMQRKTANEACERLRNLDAVPLRRQCLRFVLDNREAIRGGRPELPDSLNDRAGDIWEPLLVLADLAGGSWPEAARQSATALTSNAQESSPIGSLLTDILLEFTRAQTERIFSRTLAAALNSLPNRPWMTLKKAKGVTEMWLAQQLRPYGIRPKTIWIGTVQAKGYEQADFNEVLRRYVSLAEVESMIRMR